MKLFAHIREFQRKIRWRILRKKLKYGGNDGRIGKGIQVANPQYIQIGNNFSSGAKLKLQVWQINDSSNMPNMSIGNNVSIIDNCQISCVYKITIGDGCLLGDNVFITDNYHGSNSLKELDVPPHERKVISKGAVGIGKNVWIGRNVCIMPGVSIGDGAVIGANAVVTHDIPDRTIAAGIPGKIIRTIL